MKRLRGAFRKIDGVGRGDVRNGGHEVPGSLSDSRVRLGCRRALGGGGMQPQARRCGERLVDGVADHLVGELPAAGALRDHASGERRPEAIDDAPDVGIEEAGEIGER